MISVGLNGHKADNRESRPTHFCRSFREKSVALLVVLSGLNQANRPSQPSTFAPSPDEHGQTGHLRLAPWQRPLFSHRWREYPPGRDHAETLKRRNEECRYLTPGSTKKALSVWITRLGMWRYWEPRKERIIVTVAP